jgi:hypothetical protein
MRLGGLVVSISLVATLGACSAPPGADIEVQRGALALGSCGATILPVAKATASSEQNNGFFSAAKAVDGDSSTRWSSNQGMPQWLELDLGQVAFVSELDIDWQTAFATSFQVEASNNGTSWGTVAVSSASQSGFQFITGLNVTTRFLRILATGATNFGNVSIVEAQVVGDPNSACVATSSGCGQSLKLLPSAAQASSTQFSYTPASAAIDQDWGTRWSSNATDTEWLSVDLGSKARVDGVRITWEHAFAQQYAVQSGGSLQGPWTTLATVNGQFGPQTVNLGVTTRFLRVLGLKRATSYGYSIWELDVYGSRDSSCFLKGPWQFDAANTTMTPNTGFYTINGNAISIDFSGQFFDFGPAGSGIVFQQPVPVVQGGSYALTLNVDNRNRTGAPLRIALRGVRHRLRSGRRRRRHGDHELRCHVQSRAQPDDRSRSQRRFRHLPRLQRRRGPRDLLGRGFDGAHSLTDSDARRRRAMEALEALGHERQDHVARIFDETSRCRCLVALVAQPLE